MHGFLPVGSDLARTQLRVTVAAIERELSRVTSPSSELLSLWSTLVGQLALGPEPEVRECPVCQHIGRLDATRCGYCWARLRVPTRGTDVTVAPKDPRQ